MRRTYLLLFPIAVACSTTRSYSGPTELDAGTPPDCLQLGTCGLDAAVDASIATCIPDPANFDVPGNGCDDDGNGLVDDEPACDTTLSPKGNAFDFARAIELCPIAGPDRWGVISAKFTDGYGSPDVPNAEQHAIASGFGPLKPRANASLGLLSTGFAHEYDLCDSPTGTFKGGCRMADKISVLPPPGYPKAAVGCKILPNVTDFVSVNLTIKVPKNASGLLFDFDFASGEWPEWVCTPYNDSFVVFLTSTAFHGGTPENISFDANANPVSVNAAFFDRCEPVGAEMGCDGVAKAMKANGAPPPACAGGGADLVGTGFHAPGDYCGSGVDQTGGGMTGWLTTRAPVTPNETITLEFMIWDTGDSSFDSSVLLDHFRWQVDPTAVNTGRPPK